MDPHSPSRRPNGALRHVQHRQGRAGAKKSAYCRAVSWQTWSKCGTELVSGSARNHTTCREQDKRACPAACSPTIPDPRASPLLDGKSNRARGNPKFPLHRCWSLRDLLRGEDHHGQANRRTAACSPCLGGFRRRAYRIARNPSLH